MCGLRRSSPILHRPYCALVLLLLWYVTPAWHPPSLVWLATGRPLLWLCAVHLVARPGSSAMDMGDGLGISAD
eukprot:11217483-Lingulodinium_polyedra.AAC.1